MHGTTAGIAAFTDYDLMLDTKPHVLCYVCFQQLAIKQKEECLELLSKVLPEREHEVVALARRIGEQGNNNAVDAEEDPGAIDRDGINLVASLALLMGETYEALGNRENATVYFRIALRCDVQCSEAFFHLFDKQMLSADEEKQLVASLNYSADEMNMLQSLYQIHVGKVSYRDAITPCSSHTHDGYVYDMLFSMTQSRQWRPSSRKSETRSGFIAAWMW